MLSEHSSQLGSAQASNQCWEAVAERSIGSMRTVPANQNVHARAERSQARAKLGLSKLRFRITEPLQSVVSPAYRLILYTGYPQVSYKLEGSASAAF